MGRRNPLRSRTTLGPVPIYEFYCPDCHRVFSFFSRAIDTVRRPACPRCSGAALERRASAFAISKGRPEKAGGEAGVPELPNFDEAKLEQAMAALASEAEGVNEDDPRQQARLMRKLFDATGLPVQGGMAEALRRLESGEDPEAIEQQMGDVFEGDPFAGAPERIAGLKHLRRALPPSVDPTLYEM